MILGKPKPRRERPAPKRVSRGAWITAKAQAIVKRGPYCETCKTEYATDGHHCLIPFQKRYAEYLDHEINLELACHYDHMTGDLDTYEHRKEFYLRQVARYGKQAVDAWIESLPEKLKISHRLDFMEAK